MTNNDGTGATLSLPSLTAEYPTPCRACRAAVVIDAGRVELAHVDTCHVGTNGGTR